MISIPRKVLLHSDTRVLSLMHFVHILEAKFYSEHSSWRYTNQQDCDKISTQALEGPQR